MCDDTNDFPVFKGSIEEFEVPKNDPFKNDKLNRKPYIETLTNVVRSFQYGTVIALNGAWGTGKTTFIRMWKQHLENNHFPIAYYNAWEDDISEEPLFSLLRQLRNGANKKDGKKLAKVLKTGAKILGRITIAGAKASMGKVSEIIINAGEESAKEIKKVIEEAGKGGLDAIQGAFEDSLKNEKDDMQSLMKDFRKDFRSYVEYDKKEERDAVPFVYFIDELDRCNPTFAVKVLERIKHLFDVRNVVFILSVDKKQLALSINGFFGSERFDSDEYLRRFIDIEYNMPHHVAPLYFDCLETKYGITHVFSNYMHEYKNYEDTYSYYHRLVIELFNANDISLRQLEKIFTLVQLMLCDESFIHSFIKTVEENYFIPLCFFMSYLKVCNNDIYQGILSRSYSLQELSEALENLLPQERNTDYFFERDISNDYDHNELCILLVLAHYCEAKVLERKRFLKEADASEESNETSFEKPSQESFVISFEDFEYETSFYGLYQKAHVTSYEELSQIKFRIIPPDLLRKYNDLFDRELKSIFVWIDKMEMF